MIRNISTLQQTDNLRLLISRQKGEVNKASMELATGLRRDVFAARGASSAQSLQFRSMMSSSEAYMVANRTLATQLDVTSKSLSDVREIASDFMGILISGDIASTNRDTLQSSARSALEAMVNKLNTSYNGSYLFSGTATDQKPLTLNADMTVSYVGGDVDLTSSISDDTTLLHGVRADNPDIMAILNTLSSVANADMNAMTQQEFSDFRELAATTIASSSERVTSVQARLGDNEARLERMIARQSDMSRIYTAAILDIEGVDPEEAAIRLEGLSIQLQSTFEVTARLSQLSFLNYMR